jgi:iron(III) transport system ATP-binding protein
VRRTASAVIKERTTRTIELVGLAHLADRYATKLSGGQRQRVALARAIVYEPKVVLFDGSLSNLDAKLRERMRIELVRLQREVGITSIEVTHDQSESLVMSDRIVVMAGPFTCPSAPSTDSAWVESRATRLDRQRARCAILRLQARRQ